MSIGAFAHGPPGPTDKSIVQQEEKLEVLSQAGALEKIFVVESAEVIENQILPVTPNEDAGYILVSEARKGRSSIQLYEHRRVDRSRFIRCGSDV